MKNVRVILLEPVAGLGAIGTLASVKAGYARNFLVPKGFALMATDKNLKVLEAKARSKAKKLAEVKIEAERLAGQMAELVVELKAKAGEGKIYGAITAQAVAEAVERQTGLEIDRRKLDMVRNIKDLGEYEVIYKPHPEVPIVLKLNITAL
jgi:large subunit ribosomal protein L9